MEPMRGGDERSSDERVLLLEELLRARMLLFSELEHKLKTSFAVIAGWGEMLTRQWSDMSDQDRRDAVGWLHKKSAEIVDQAETLLEQTHAELASLDADSERVDIAAVARELVTAHQGVAHAHRFRYVGDDTAEVVLDAAALQQVLGQLVENAVKYSPDGGNVTIGVVVQGTEVELSVEDEGVGVPSDRDVDIFAPFVRGPGAEEVAASGTGVGLYVVSNLVRAMRGRVTCARNDGRPGSRFTVTIPRV